VSPGAREPANPRTNNQGVEILDDGLGLHQTQRKTGRHFERAEAIATAALQMTAVRLAPRFAGGHVRKSRFDNGPSGARADAFERNSVFDHDEPAIEPPPGIRYREIHEEYVARRNTAWKFSPYLELAQRGGHQTPIKDEGRDHQTGEYDQ